MKSTISAFWIWFAEWHPDIAAAYDSGDLQWLATELTSHVRAIERRLNWEIGPYHLPDQTLVISPGVRDNIALAKRIVAAAPKIAGWKFLPAKLPKRMNHLVMELPGRGARVEADAWMYQLTSFNKAEFFDIDVFTDADDAIARRDLELLTHRLLEAILGEALYLDRIAAVRVHLKSTDGPEELTPLPLLARHLASILGE